ncbi:MAG: aminotransferase class I/II-fold pyridoxal phosphate-dependent enzyme [Aquincola sp.]|nr:aminotransferase class I/II-fold pyridoxal phosphate-dependent enzyme [Aquincola sp.]
MPTTASRLNVFTESVIRGTTRMSDEYGAINLSQGFPDFDPPEVMLSALERAGSRALSSVCGDMGRATLPAGAGREDPALRGIEVDPDQHLVVTCGSTEAMAAALMTTCNPGDKVIVFSPFYENYAADAILAGAEPIYVHLRPPHFAFDPDELRAAFEQKPKAIVICNPGNPTGKVFTRDELQFILALAEEHDCYAITDEPYEHVVYAPHVHTYMCALPGAAERVITCNSLSKTYSITGWRLGYLHGPPAVVAQARKVHDFLTIGAAAPLQEAAVAGLELPDSYYHGLTATYTAKRTLFLEYLRQAGLPFTEPQGAYYVMVDIGTLGFATNSNYLAEHPELSAPTSWDDLIKPEWQGQILVAHPSSSGTSYTALCTIIQMRGEEAAWEYQRTLTANVLQFTRSGGPHGRPSGTRSIPTCCASCR